MSLIWDKGKKVAVTSSKLIGFCAFQAFLTNDKDKEDFKAKNEECSDDHDTFEFADEDFEMKAKEVLKDAKGAVYLRNIWWTWEMFPTSSTLPTVHTINDLVWVSE